MKSKKAMVLCALTVLLSILAIAAATAVILSQKQELPAVSPGPAAQYESNIILDDPRSLQDAVDEMIAKAKEGQMKLEMKMEAYSRDGENFSCFLSNAQGNQYEMYLVLYLDETQEEIYRSGLIPLGARIEEFTTARKLEQGTYACTLEYNQVKEDKTTVQATVNVGLTLKVSP